MSQEYFDAAAAAYVNSVGDEVEFEGETIRAVFGHGFVSVSSGDVRIGSRRPELEVRLADLPDGTEAKKDPPLGGDQVTIRGTAFEVATVRPDVEGVSAVLVLKAV